MSTRNAGFVATLATSRGPASHAVQSPVSDDPLEERDPPDPDPDDPAPDGGVAVPLPGRPEDSSEPSPDEPAALLPGAPELSVATAGDWSPAPLRLPLTAA